MTDVTCKVCKKVYARSVPPRTPWPPCPFGDMLGPAWLGDAAQRAAYCTAPLLRDRDADETSANRRRES